MIKFMSRAFLFICMIGASLYAKRLYDERDII